MKRKIGMGTSYDDVVVLSDMRPLSKHDTFVGRPLVAGVNGDRQRYTGFKNQEEMVEIAQNAYDRGRR